MKKEPSRTPQLSFPNLLMGGGLIGIILLLGIWFVARQDEDETESPFQESRNSEVVEMPHVHGLGFSADGQQLIVPSHIGLAVFEDNHWARPEIPAHDYMGYSSVDDGFFSSGHPSLQTEFVNPLGLVRSTDNGQTITTIDFAGESDFHVMAVGYQNHAIYVFNPAPNSKLSAGIHYSLDEGETWEESQAQGITGEIIQLAVHPTDAAIMAAASDTGAFLSRDHGYTFERIGETAPITAVSFLPDGTGLYFGYKTLHRYDLTSQEVETISVPTFSGDDGIAYIAANPVQDELVFSTFSRDIYLSRNAEDWQQIARQGIGINP